MENHRGRATQHCRRRQTYFMDVKIEHKANCENKNIYITHKPPANGFQFFAERCTEHQDLFCTGRLHEDGLDITPHHCNVVKTLL